MLTATRFLCDLGKFPSIHFCAIRCGEKLRGYQGHQYFIYLMYIVPCMSNILLLSFAILIFKFIATLSIFVIYQKLPLSQSKFTLVHTHAYFNVMVAVTPIVAFWHKTLQFLMLSDTGALLQTFPHNITNLYHLTAH